MNEKYSKRTFPEKNLKRRSRSDYLDDFDIKRRMEDVKGYVESSSKYDNFGRINKNLFIKEKKIAKDQLNTPKSSNRESNDVEKKDFNNHNDLIKNNSESESELIKKFFGIEHFDTSKNKDHSSSSISCSNVKSKRKYRQYMNRPGGFNRLLSPTQ